MAREITSKAVYHGDHAETSGADEFVRCARCGFPCKLDRDKQGHEGSKIGWGINYTEYPIVTATYDSSDLDYNPDTVVYNYDNVYDDSDLYDGGSGTAYDGVIRTIYDPVVTGGCPQCGTFLYNK
jgi:hypothetical protein